MAPLLNAILLPVILLSGILLPMNISVDWIDDLSDVIPIKHVVNAVRASFVGDITSAPVFWGSFWAVLLTAVAVWWGTRTFRKENA